MQEEPEGLEKILFAILVALVIIFPMLSRESQWNLPVISLFVVISAAMWLNHINKDRRKHQEEIKRKALEKTNKPE